MDCQGKASPSFLSHQEFWAAVDFILPIKNLLFYRVIKFPLEGTVLTIRSFFPGECVSVCALTPTLHSSVCTHWVDFGWVGADASQGRRCVCLSLVICPLPLCCSVVWCRVKRAGAGSGILPWIVIGNTVLCVGQWFCLEEGEKLLKTHESKQKECTNVVQYRLYTQSQSE